MCHLRHSIRGRPLDLGPPLRLRHLPRCHGEEIVQAPQHMGQGVGGKEELCKENLNSYMYEMHNSFQRKKEENATAYLYR